MSQVKNLRAMFENKGDDSSPPDRGRSPSGLAQATGTASNGSDSPRPLSKVRTNFVAIEKDGRMGLRRDPSHEDSPSREPTSTEPDLGAPSTPVPEDLGKTPRKLFTKEPVPDLPRSPAAPTIQQPPQEELGALTDKPSLNPDKQTDEESSTPSLTPAEPTEKALPKDSKPKPKHPASAPKAKADAGKGDHVVPTSQPTGGAKKTTAARSTGAPAKAPARTTAKPTATTKTATSTVKRPEPKPAAKSQDKVTSRREGATASSSSGPKSASSATSRKPPPVKVTQEHDAGFVKPKPKSPTKPVNLPASLMAPTASSVSKGTTGTRQSVSRQSGNLRPPSAAGRSPSRTSVSATATSSTKTIKRQASSINRPRPSVGPPPKKPAQDHPVTKRESHVDEGFLARMMRPTQSSSSKTHEKAPPTPPRKASQRPSTSHTDRSSRRASSVKRRAIASPASEHMVSPDASEVILESTARSVPESTPEEPIGKASSASRDGGSELAPPSSDASGLEASQTEAQGSAKSPTAELEPAPESAVVKETAPITAQVETVEEVSSLAEQADLVQTPVEPKDSNVGEQAQDVASTEGIQDVTNGAEEAKTLDLADVTGDSNGLEPRDLTGASIKEPSAVETAGDTINVPGEAGQSQTVPEDGVAEPNKADRVVTPVQGVETTLDLPEDEANKTRDDGFDKGIEADG